MDITFIGKPVSAMKHCVKVGLCISENQTKLQVHAINRSVTTEDQERRVQTPGYLQAYCIIDFPFLLKA